MEKDQSFPDQCFRKIKFSGNIFNGLFLINKNMGGIVAVIPVFKSGSVIIQMRHAQQRAARLKQAVQQGKFFVGIMEMLHHLAAGDIIIGFPQTFRMVREKRIISPNGIIPLPQNLRYDRSGPGAEIESLMVCCKMLENMIRNGRNEFPVAGIMHIVQMFTVTIRFPFRRKIITLIFENTGTDGTDKIAIAAESITGVLA